MNRRRSLPGLLRDAWRGLRLRDAVVFTLPVVLSVLLLVLAAILDYRHARQFDDWWSHRSSIPAAFRSRVDALLQAPRAATLRLQLDPEAADPGVLRLRLEPESRSTLLGGALDGWDRWADATLVRGGDRVPVELRKRGDTSVHFTSAKTSFSLKLPRASLLAGQREVAVTGKTVLASFLANRVPGELGCLAPRTAIAPVFINERFYGVFRLAETVDESFLRKAGRMPGNVFRADAAERGEYRKGVERNVFWNPRAWELAASGDSVPGVPVDSALVGLLVASNGTTFEHHLRAMERVDRAQLSCMLAATLLVADPYHMSAVHNQFWYEDPTTGLLSPIPWDLRLLALDGPGERLNDFLQGAIRNPHLVADVMARLAGALEGDELERWAEGQLAEVEERFGPYIRYELLRRRAISDPGAPRELLSRFRENLGVLRERLADSRVRVASGTTADGVAILDLETAGWAGSELVEVRVGSAEGPFRLLADTDLDGRPGVGDEEVPVRAVTDSSGTRLRLREPLPLPTAWTAPERGIRPGAVRYRLFVVGGGPGSSPVRPVLRNPHTGAPSRELPWARTPATDRGWSPWRYPDPEPPARRTLSGEVRLAQDLHVPEGTVLEIAPGTTLRLAPGVSVLSEGRVLAPGRPDAPIRILPEAGGQPWGTFALQGEGASGSRFEHVTFREGSSGRPRRVGYKGMVSVHHARDVSFRAVRFERNLRSDDALNVVHATVAIEDCDFVEANSDGVDFDYSDGSVRDSRFVRSRGDGIDLMSSSPLVVGNVMEGSGDKGISVGEASHPVIASNRIVDGNRGIEVKDGSRPWIVHTVITRNRVGLLQRVKNWRYGTGGRAIVSYSRIFGNGTDLRGDSRSRLTLVRSEIGPPTEVADPPAGIASASAGEVLHSIGRAEAPPGEPSTSPDWVHARLGLAPGDRHPGLLEKERVSGSAEPFVRFEFEEELGGGLDGWAGQGGVDGLGIREGELVAEVEGRAGSVGRPLSWTLPDDGRRYQATVELGGSGLGDVRVAFVDGSGTAVGTRVRLQDDPGRRTLITLDLPPGRYTEIRLEVEPRQDAQRVNPDTGMLEVQRGRLRLGRVEVHAWHPFPEER